MRSAKTSSGGVTIRDVAAKAGVSVATISRVFNEKGPVKEGTRRRILALAEEMRYVPHAAARSLSTRTTNTIAVVLPELHGEFFSEVIRGIDLAAREFGFHLLVSGSHSDRAEMQAVLRLIRGRVDGLILMSPDLEPSALFNDLPPDLPVVMLNAAIESHPCITIDNFGGAKKMVQHLTSLGHERIAFICGPKQNVDASERLRGFRAGLRTARVRREVCSEIDGAFTERSGYEAAEKIVKLAERPTAVFAANDTMAIGVLSAFHERGIRVPADCAVAGFDDIPIAPYLAPPLTTIRVPIAALGRAGFELLLNAGERGGAASKLETSLVIRQSCGAGGTREPHLKKVKSSAVT